MGSQGGRGVMTSIDGRLLFSFIQKSSIGWNCVQWRLVDVFLLVLFVDDDDDEEVLDVVFLDGRDGCAGLFLSTFLTCLRRLSNRWCANSHKSVSSLIFFSNSFLTWESSNTSLFASTKFMTGLSSGGTCEMMMSSVECGNPHLCFSSRMERRNENCVSRCSFRMMSWALKTLKVLCSMVSKFITLAVLKGHPCFTMLSKCFWISENT